MVTDGACLSTKPKFAPRWQFNPAESINGFLPDRDSEQIHAPRKPDSPVKPTFVLVGGQTDQ
jgi:hypothetical protein